MSTQIAISFSQANDIQEATYQTAVAIKNQLNSVQTDLVMVFATPRYATAEMLNVLHSVLKPKRLVGSCTTALILSEGVFPQGIAALGINSDEMLFGTMGGRPSGDDLRTAGFDWGRKLHADFKSTAHQACLLFLDPILQNNFQFIRGVQDVLGFPILGAISSDDLQVNKPPQFFQDQILTQSAVGLLLGGIQTAIGNKHGFKPLGKPRTITKTENNILVAIDDQPAMRLYEEFLGPEASALKKGLLSQHALLYPLGIYLEDQRQYLLKNAIDILSDGSIVCQGDVPQGAEVHLMIGNRESCKNSAIDAANQIKDVLGGRQARLIIIIESVGRYKILRNQAFIEVQVIKDILGYTTPIIGMYASGEVVPSSVTQANSALHLQNESILIMAVI